jgi:glycosyltransferase involved in cell wall biosynthesis
MRRTRVAFPAHSYRFGGKDAGVEVFGSNQQPLRVCLASYRSNPHSGGQGVYVRNLSRALRDLGHCVDVVSGPPDPGLDEGIRLIPLPCLDLYHPADPFRMPTARELADPVNLLEWVGVSTMGFPEPMTFGLRAFRFLKGRLSHYDILHDNQSLSYGVWALSRRIPTVATIHHPITVDRRLAVRAETSAWRKIKQWRWFSCIGMQKRVARCLFPILTVSKSAAADIRRDFRLPRDRFRVVPNGIRTDLFRPVEGVERVAGRIIATNSADVPMKGLAYLLHAVAGIARRAPGLKLVVIGAPTPNGTIERLVRELGVGPWVEFTGRVSDADLVDHYARASVAVIPSVYEGFGLPAGEAMACGVPVVSTTGGGLPEVVGDAGLLVPPADAPALSRALLRLLENPQRARDLGQKGLERVRAQFTWQRAAERTAAAYREAIDAHRRLRPHPA